MKPRLAIVALVILALAVPAPMLAQAAKTEIYSIDTMTLTDKQFLTGAKDGTPARIAGELRLPKGSGPFPAVVLIHGSGGVGANVDLWAREFNDIGVAAFLLDCFTGRGITDTIADQSQVSHFAMTYDAYRALDLLSKHPRINASRIAIMGFSKGGFPALRTSMKRFQRMYGPPNVEFAAYLPFYAAYSDWSLLEDDQVSDRPIRMFHGDKDDYVSAESCRMYIERLYQAGKDAQITIYPGARHMFDNSSLPAVVSFPNAVVSKLCKREERAGGEIFNRDTGKPFTWQDACVTRGASVGFDPNAYGEAKKAVEAFLIETFKLTPTAVQLRNQLVGTYRLISYTRTVVATGETTDMFGKAPQGYIIYGHDGRMMILYVSDKRPQPKDLATMTDQERVDLFKTMQAYTGTYEFDGKKVTHHVDISWNQIWTGTDLVRNVRVEGKRVTLTTMPAPSPLDGKVNVAVLTWEKVD
jgi:dienelactone hydrolase